MKTFTTFLLAVLCLFSSHAFGQKGSIEKLLERNGFEWKSGLAQPSNFDNELSAVKEAEVVNTRIGPTPGKGLMPTQALGGLKKLNFTPMSLKEALQFRDPQNGLYAGMHYGKTTVFLGSSFLVGKKTYYPTLYWDQETKKGMIVMTDDPFCCGEVNVVAKR